MGTSQRRGWPAGAGSQHLPCFGPGGGLGQPGFWPLESLRVCRLPIFLLPPPSPPVLKRGAFKRQLGYPGGGNPSADREAAALGRDAPHFLLQLPSPPPPPPPGSPPPSPPPLPPPPPLPRSVVFCSRGEKCYVRKVPGGTGWGHAPRALPQAPARSPLYEVRLGVPGPRDR